MKLTQNATTMTFSMENAEKIPPMGSLQNELDGQIFKSPLEKTVLVHTMTPQYG